MYWGKEPLGSAKCKLFVLALHNQPSSLESSSLSSPSSSLSPNYYRANSECIKFYCNRVSFVVLNFSTYKSRNFVIFKTISLLFLRLKIHFLEMENADFS